VKLVHLIGFIIRIRVYHDARSSECQHIYTRPKLLVSNETNCCHGEMNIEGFLTFNISEKVKQALG